VVGEANEEAEEKAEDVLLVNDCLVDHLGSLTYRLFIVD
jgi:hypothetical protein